MLYDLIPSVLHFHATRNNKSVTYFNCRTEDFFHKWMKQTWYEDWKYKSYNAFKKPSLNFTWPLHFFTFGIYNPVALQLLARLRIGLSHVNEHKFTHNFCDFLNLLCSCNLEPEKTFHYLLRCHLFQIDWRTLLNEIKVINEHNITCHIRINAINMIKTDWFYYLLLNFPKKVKG